MVACAVVRISHFCSRYGLTWRQLYNRCTPATAFLEALPCPDEATPPHFLALTCRDRALASVLALSYQPSHQQLGEDHVKTCTPPRLIKGKHPETYKTPGERFRASISTTIWPDKKGRDAQWDFGLGDSPRTAPPMQPKLKV